MNADELKSFVSLTICSSCELRPGWSCWEKVERVKAAECGTSDALWQALAQRNWPEYLGDIMATSYTASHSSSNSY